MADYLKAQGLRLRTARKALNVSQEEAAHLIGVSFKTYNSWENGKSEPRDRNWRKIEEILKVRADEMRGEPEPAQLDRIEELLNNQATLQERLRGIEETLAALLDQFRKDS